MLLTHWNPRTVAKISLSVTCAFSESATPIWSNPSPSFRKTFDTSAHQTQSLMILQQTQYVIILTISDPIWSYQLLKRAQTATSCDITISRSNHLWQPKLAGRQLLCLTCGHVVCTLPGLSAFFHSGNLLTLHLHVERKKSDGRYVG